MPNSKQYTLRKRPILAFVLLAFSLVTASVQAEFLGLPSGRTGDLAMLPDMSIEGGYVVGEFFNADYTLLGVRLNYKLNPKVVAYGDLGKTKVGSLKDTVFGVGFFYQLQKFVDFGESSVKGSFHTASLTGSGRSKQIMTCGTRASDWWERTVG